MRVWPHLATAVAAGAVACAAVAAGPGPAPRVRIPGGSIVGVRSTNGSALLYRAIPFAAAPLGPLRWKEPQPVKPWTGDREATGIAPSCLQNDYGWNRADSLRGREDCLTLDVRTPALTGKRPVMVWIHGGSNRAGSAGDTVLSSITDKGVVLVAIQYRLGVFGFLAPRGAASETGGTAGNYGLMDQIAALRWVHDTIARFGGDPSNVTLFGESAGSQDVSLLLASPAARGLFRRAILESGTPGFGMPPRSLAAANGIADQIGPLLGNDGSIAALRRSTPDALLAADRKLTDPSLVTNDYLWLKTTVDGAVLPRAPRDLLAQAPPRAVLIGSNRAEFGPDKGSLGFPAALKPIFAGNSDRAAAFYRFGDPDRATDPRLGYPELEFSTDWIFRCPAGRVADLLSAHGAPVWRYEFDIGADGGLATHAGELRYVFADTRLPGGYALQDYWVNFARTGDPNGAGLPLWPRYDAAAQRHILFETRGATPQQHLRGPLCGLLDAL